MLYIITMNLNQFFYQKEPQKTYKFKVYFLDSGKYRPNGDSIPQIRNFDVTNISLPTYSFKKEIQKFGNFPKSFPVLDHDGFEITILFEETADHRVGRFVNWLQRKIMQSDGIYNPPDRSKFDRMIVRILNDFDQVVAEYVFPNVYFLRLQNVIYDYSTNEITRYEITFGGDIQNLEIFNNVIPAELPPGATSFPTGTLDNVRDLSNQS